MTGALMGGILGAAVGGRGAGNRIAGAAVGALAGGLIGSAIGASLDEEDRQLAYAAEMQALEAGAPGVAVGWRSERTRYYGSVVPGPYYENGGRRCRSLHAYDLCQRAAGSRTRHRMPGSRWSLGCCKLTAGWEFMEKAMMRMTWNFARGALCAAALTAVSAGLAAAAPATVGTNTNLRQGPGTNFGVIMTVPGGSVVDVIRCGGEWCNVMADGRPGYMIARNLGLGGAPVAVVRAGPPVVVVGPGPYYGYGPYYWLWARATMVRAAIGAAGDGSNALKLQGYRPIFA